MRNQGAYLKIFLAAAAIGLLVFFSQSSPFILVRAGILRMFKFAFSSASDLRMALVGGISGKSDGIANPDDGRFKLLEFQLELLKEENKNLHSLLAFEKESGVKLYGARVISYQKEFGKEFLLVEFDNTAAPAIDMPVVDSEGVLVGVIEEITGGFLKVEIASNPGLAFEVEVIPIRTRAIAKGLGSRTFSVELIAQDIPVKAGDFIALFRPSFPPLFLGGIVNVETSAAAAFKESKATLIARPEILREVFLVIPTR